MSKHTKPSSFVESAIRETQKNRRRILWLTLCAVSIVVQIADLSHVLMLGVIFDHVAELIIGTGVSRYIESR